MPNFFSSKIVVTLAIGVCLFLAALFFISTGYYPVAMVNGKFISAISFWQAEQAAIQFTQNQNKVESQTQEISADTQKEIASGVLERLIENSIIDTSARQELGGDFDSLVMRQVEKYKNNDQLGTISKALYGLTAEGFSNYILIPEAEKDVLAGRLLLKNVHFVSWLKEKKLSASVHIFSPNFDWNGGKVVAK